MKKEHISDGQTKTPAPLFLHTSKTLKSLFEPEPSDIFFETIKDLKTYAKVPRRIKTKLKQKTSHGFSRSLSFEEIAATERRLLAAGENIITKFCNEEVKMNSEVEARLERLYEVIKKYVTIKKHFKSNMLKGRDANMDRLAITDDERYFDRTIRDDLNRLRKKE